MGCITFSHRRWDSDFDWRGLSCKTFWTLAMGNQTDLYNFFGAMVAVVSFGRANGGCCDFYRGWYRGTASVPIGEPSVDLPTRETPGEVGIDVAPRWCRWIRRVLAFRRPIELPFSNSYVPSHKHYTSRALLSCCASLARSALPEAPSEKKNLKLIRGNLM